jgi:hypothetical protein
MDSDRYAKLRKRIAYEKAGLGDWTPEQIASAEAAEALHAEVPTSKPKPTKVVLTDRKLKSLKPAPDGKPYFAWDITVPGFGVRVMGKPEAPVKSFGVMKRFPGSPVKRDAKGKERVDPTFWAFGRYGAMSLQEGRDKARVSLAQIAKGCDPRREEERQRRAAIEAERAKQEATVEAALEAYFVRKAGLRTIGEIKRDMRREFRDWLSWPLRISPRTR